MSSREYSAKEQLRPSSIQGASEMAQQIRSFPWSETAIGAIEHWPGELVNVVNLMLTSPLPMQVFWGSKLLTLYNDALAPFMAGKHPEALGQSARIVWAEAWPTVGEQLERVFTDGTLVTMKQVFLPLLQNGVMKDMYWDYTYMPLYRSDGDIAGILDITQDCSEAVRANSALRASEAQATRVLESIGDAVIVTDAEARVVRMNPVAQALTGWTMPEAADRPLTEVFHIVNESTRAVVESPADMVKRTGTIVGLANHTVLIGRNGDETAIDDSGAPVRNDHGDITEIVMVFRDISRRRAAELERDRKTAELQAFLSATADSVVGVGRDWCITFLNDAATMVYSVGRDLVGKHLWTEFPHAVFDGSPYVSHYERAMYKGIPGRFEAFYPEPLNIWIRLEVYPTPDGIVTFSRDITSEKQSQAALIETEKLAAVGRLAASIAHEINNPLEAVTNLLYLAKLTEDTAQIREYLDLAEMELRRVSVISNQTLRFYKQTTKPVEVSADELFETVLSIHQGRLLNSHITLEKRKRTTRSIECFDGEIRQVLNNLVGNAIDAMRPNGGKLIIGSRKGRSWVTGVEGIVLTVADAGSGMSPRVAQKVFDAFFTTKGASGNGLGLWVSKDIVDRHEGHLRLRSSQRLGRSGTVFTLFLPFKAVNR